MSSLVACRGKPLEDGRSLQEMGVESGDQAGLDHGRFALL